MKLFAAVLPIIFSVSAHAAACEPIRQIKFEMNLISSNIANVNTTRTPEGGPYKRFIRSYSGNSYEYIQSLTTIDRFEPNHPDANLTGYVAYPDIDLRAQTDEMDSLAEKYEVALIKCASR